MFDGIVNFHEFNGVGKLVILRKRHWHRNSTEMGGVAIPLYFFENRHISSTRYTRLDKTRWANGTKMMLQIIIF